MGNNASTPSQIISLPKGGGAQHGLGEKFSPDLQTGTGNFTVPLALPAGRNGFQPQLNLVYSTGHGNGVFGLGWGLSIPGVSRMTSKGNPRYRDYAPEFKSWDTFVLSGAEDLVPVSGLRDSVTHYRPRTEGLFAEITHRHASGENYWRVRSKDGLVSYYGSPSDSAERPYLDDAAYYKFDPAVIQKPKIAKTDPNRIFAWKLTLTKDAFGNRIEYIYGKRDQSSDADHQAGHRWDQPLLTQIRYADYLRGGQQAWLVTVSFEYDEREDPFSEYRAGFEIRTSTRCKSVLLETRADKVYKVRRYEFHYANSSKNRVSLLKSIEVVGFDDAGVEARELPPLDFGYSQFTPEDQKQRDFYPIQGPDLPAASLADTSMELVDLFGNGLPDLLQMNGGVRYWRNRGNGKFDPPRPMADAPAGISLNDPGVQLIDADGDGRTDLLVTQGPVSGYYALQFGGIWDRRSFRTYRNAPTFDLKNPEIRLLDLTGDGVTDVIRSGTRLECFFNDPDEGWGETRWVERRLLEKFPDINFSDPRVKWADLSGDGMQDLVLVYEGNVEYWPNLGYGSWGSRLHMKNSPRFPFGYDPRRILLGDIDGDGLADLVYIDDRKITIWINQSGNAWSDPIEISGTPPVSDMDAIRLIDLLGSGVAGVLWSRDATSSRQDHYFFLDLTGSTKPYMLVEMNNNMGAFTRVGYAPSTRFYLEDEASPARRWRTPLPFPVQVVARVEVIDDLSKGKLTTEYRYHGGYRDGVEHELRGFATVEQFDTEIFDTYNKRGFHGEGVEFDDFQQRPQQFAASTLMKTWFHQGPIGEERGGWHESDWSNDYWAGDPQLLQHTESVNDVLAAIDRTHAALDSQKRRRIRRDALRSLRGSILRTELYGLDGSTLQYRPYTVTEHAYSIQEVAGAADGDWPHIFFPHAVAQRTTQWERGDDPMTNFSFNGKYDEFGQPLSQTAVAVPRRTRRRLRLNAAQVADETRVLMTHSRTAYATTAANQYIHDRVAHGTSIELRQPPEIAESDPGDLKSVLRNQKTAAFDVHNRCEEDFANWTPERGVANRYRVFGHSVSRYDGNAYTGLAVGSVGTRGALTLSETLVFTNETLTQAYPAQPLINTNGQLVLPVGPPANFPAALGYRVVTNESGYCDGYYVKSQQRKYDFHNAAAPTNAGLVTAQRDPLDHEMQIAYDTYGVLPETVTDPINLQTTAAYNYRVMQPKEVADPNNNVTTFIFSPIGLLKEIWVKGKPNRNEGDRIHAGTELTYDFFAHRNSVSADPADPQPIGVRTVRYVEYNGSETIETREYSDGFGRLLQTRTQGEEVRFGDSTFGGGEEVLPSNQSDGRGSRLIGRVNTSVIRPNVTVSGWQRYDNKGRVVEKHEPFFDVGWEYDPPDDDQLGAKATMFYDPRGQVIRTVNPDGAEQRVIYGIPDSLTDPPLLPSDTTKFAPTPWEAYTYDPNDLAPVSFDPEPAPGGGLQPLTSRAPRHHHFTPSSIVIDAMGRTRLAIQRNRQPPAPMTVALPPIEEFRTRSTHDIQGNLLTIIDPLDRVAFVHAYDLSKRALRIESIDGGTRQTVLNAVGNEVYRRDSKGSLSLNRYDVLNRPLELWARDRNGQAITLREQLEYGDESNPNQTPQERTAERNKNRLGKLAQHYDEAGRVKLALYDFKGNLLDKTREVISDNALAAGWIANWSAANADNDLDGDVYQTTTQYDALNRPVQVLYPADVNGPRAQLVPTYNRAGALEQVSLDGNIYVQRIAYDAKGQRTFIAYGNSVFTRLAYDEQTFRLKRLRTEHFTRTGDDYQPNGALLQDFAYVYDLAGNILTTHDRVPGCGVPNDPDKLDRAFGYDAIYRLTSATGRECNIVPVIPYWLDTPHCQDVTSTRRYTQNYRYDPAGNMVELNHDAANGGDFTRKFSMVAGNNRLETVRVGATVYDYSYDDNGNMTQETLSRVFTWDHAERLQEFQETTGANPSVRARYLYDSTGMRVKKWVRKNGTAANDESTIYVDGIFEFNRWKELGQTKSNNRLHVMDTQRRIALVRVGDMDDQKPDVQYHLGDHLGSSNVVVGGPAAADDGLINREEFLPYGETSFGSFGRKRYRFAGKELDDASGFVHYPARYYAPRLGRWIAADPLAPVAGLNAYQFLSSSPMSRTDQTGLADGPVCKVDLVVGKYGDVGGHHPVQSAAYTPAPGKADPLYRSMMSVAQNQGAFTHEAHVDVNRAQIAINKAAWSSVTGEPVDVEIGKGKLRVQTLEGPASQSNLTTPANPIEDVSLGSNPEFVQGFTEVGRKAPTPTPYFEEVKGYKALADAPGNLVPPDQAAELVQAASNERTNAGSPPRRVPTAPSGGGKTMTSGVNVTLNSLSVATAISTAVVMGLDKARMGLVQISGVAVLFDPHKVPYGTVFTDIDTGMRGRIDPDTGVFVTIDMF